MPKSQSYCTVAKGIADPKDTLLVDLLVIFIGFGPPILSAPTNMANKRDWAHYTLKYMGRCPIPSLLNEAVR